MSDRTGADTGTATATDAVASAAEQVRASASGAYDASKKAASYVGEMSDRVRSETPSASEAAQYVTRNARENPMSGFLGAAAVVCVLGYFLRNRR